MADDIIVVNHDSNDVSAFEYEKQNDNSTSKTVSNMDLILMQV